MSSTLFLIDHKLSTPLHPRVSCSAKIYERSKTDIDSGRKKKIFFRTNSFSFPLMIFEVSNVWCNISYRLRPKCTFSTVFKRIGVGWKCGWVGWTLEGISRPVFILPTEYDLPCGWVCRLPLSYFQLCCKPL